MLESLNLNSPSSTRKARDHKLVIAAKDKFAKKVSEILRWLDDSKDETIQDLVESPEPNDNTTELRENAESEVPSDAVENVENESTEKLSETMSHSSSEDLSEGCLVWAKLTVSYNLNNIFHLFNYVVFIRVTPTGQL